jgi:hypothetical protein
MPMSIFGMTELIWIKVADYHSARRSRAVRRPGRRFLASRGHCVVIDNVNQTGRAPVVMESDLPRFRGRLGEQSNRFAPADRQPGAPRSPDARIRRSDTGRLAARLTVVDRCRARMGQRLPSAKRRPSDPWCSLAASEPIDRRSSETYLRPGLAPFSHIEGSYSPQRRRSMAGRISTANFASDHADRPGPETLEQDHNSARNPSGHPSANPGQHQLRGVV